MVGNEYDLNRIVLTGGPGIGKTTSLDILASMGHQIIPEAARIIIEEQNKIGGDLVPWIRLEDFQKEVVKRQLESESKYLNGIVICDRSIIDGHAFSKLGNVNHPLEIETHARGRYSKVFLLDPLSFFVNDDCRKETPDQALQIHNAIEQSYKFFGYEPIRVPVLETPKHRAEFILNYIND